MEANGDDMVLPSCQRSSRFMLAWLERGESSLPEADKVFTDQIVYDRLKAPLHHFSGSIQASAAAPLPPKASDLVAAVESTFEIGRAAAEDLVRLYADDRLNFTLLHCEGSQFDAVDLSVDVALPHIARLLHSEHCESLRVVCCILRLAHDDSHPYSAQCRELAQRLLSEGLAEHLWQIYRDVSACPEVVAASSSSAAQVQEKVKQDLEVQIQTLECLVLAHLDLELCKPGPEWLCRVAELVLRQRFLGSFRVAADAHRSLLQDHGICFQARCVGDLCMVLLVAGFALEGLSEHTVERHPIFCSPSHARHLHTLFSYSFPDACEVASRRGAAGSSDTSVHCGRLAALAVLGWLSTLAVLPRYRETHGLSLERIMGSAVLRSNQLLVDVVEDILSRGYITTDTPKRDHRGIRRVLHGFVACVASSIDIDCGPPGLVNALPQLMRAVLHGEAELCRTFWAEEYRKRRGCFHVLHSHLAKFPASLPQLLRLIGALAGSSEDAMPAAYAVKLLTEPLRSLILPFSAIQDIVALSPAAQMMDAPMEGSQSPSWALAEASSGQQPPRRVVLTKGVYIEEVVLRVRHLLLPELQVARSVVLQPGEEGVMLESVAGEGTSPLDITRQVRWSLTGAGLSIWRMAAVSWDAALLELGWIPGEIRRKVSKSARDPAPSTATVGLLVAVCRCACEILIARPAAHASLTSELPASPQLPGVDGLVSRLTASLFACASLPEQASVVPQLLHGLAACMSSTAAASGSSSERHSTPSSLPSLPAYASFMLLLQDAPEGRNVRAFLQVLTSTLAREREIGTYPATTAGLELLLALLRSCSGELFALAWPLHGYVPTVPGMHGGGDDMGEEVQVATPSITALTAPSPATPSPDQQLRAKVARGDGREKVVLSPASIETLGLFIDFALGTCFARCPFWTSRTPVDRQQVMLVCLQIASALLPALQCFNWPSVTFFHPELEAEPEALDPDLRQCWHIITVLRTLQMRVLRSWSEASFVTALVNILCCDVVLGKHASNGAAENGRFFGFCSAAYEETEESLLGPPDVAIPGDIADIGHAKVPSVTGVDLLIGALQCMHDVLDLFLQPARTAPEYAPLVTHVLQLTTAKEQLRTGPENRVLRSRRAGINGTVPQRADLMQSLYAHACGNNEHVARSATSVIAAICSFWSRAKAGFLATRVPTSAKASLLSLLSVPSMLSGADDKSAGADASGAAGNGADDKSATRPQLLSAHLLRKMISISCNSRKSWGSRTAAFDLIRVALESQPGITAEESGPLLTAAIEACGQTLSEMMGVLVEDVGHSRAAGSSYRSGSASQDPVDLKKEEVIGAIRLLLCALGLADVVAGTWKNLTASSSAVVEAISARVPQPQLQSTAASTTTSQTLWHWLRALVDGLLLPWARTGRLRSFSLPESPECFLAAFSVLRLAAHGVEMMDQVAARSADALKDLQDLLQVLLSEEGLELWFPASTSVENPDLGAAAVEIPNLEREGSILGGPMASSAEQRPFGDPGSGNAMKPLSENRAAAERVTDLLAKQGLRPFLVLPPPGVLGKPPDWEGALDAVNANNKSSAMAEEPSVYDRRCAIPAAFRWWSYVCEVACGSAVGPAAAVEGTSLMDALRGVTACGPGSEKIVPHWQAAQLHEMNKVEAMQSSSPDGGLLVPLHKGCWSYDAYVAGSELLLVHEPSVRFVAACICAQDRDMTAVEECNSLLEGCATARAGLVATSARVLAMEAFEHLVRAVSRQSQRPAGAAGSANTRTLPSLAKLAGITLGRLRAALYHQDLLADHAAFFSRLLMLTSTLLMLRPGFGSASASNPVLTPFSAGPGGAGELPAGEDHETSYIDQLSLFQQEGPVGLALVHQLASTLQVCAQCVQERLPAALPPRSAGLLTGSSYGHGLADLALASLTLLLVLLPGMYRLPKQVVVYQEDTATLPSSFDTESSLEDVLLVVCSLLDCRRRSEEDTLFDSLRGAILSCDEPQAGFFEEQAKPPNEIAYAAYLFQPPDAPPPLAPPRGVLWSPDEAWSSSSSATRLKVLDHMLRCGFTSLLLAVAERTLAVMEKRHRARLQAGGSECSAVSEVVEGTLLPKILSCSTDLFAPSLDGNRLVTILRGIGTRPAIAAEVWDRAVEAAWACQLDAALSVLVTLAKSDAGALLLGNQRAFVLLARCPLFHAAVMPTDVGDFPDAYMRPTGWFQAGDPVGAATQGGGAAPWRRPLHSSWVRAMVLLGTALASAPQQLSSDAGLILEVYAPRLRYVFRHGLLNGHLAVLEEACAAMRVLALLQRYNVAAELLLSEAASQTLQFVVSACLADPTSPSDMFMPLSTAERVSAKVAVDSEASSPALVPSIFHQRVEYLALDLLRSLFQALLRTVRSEDWLSRASLWAGGPTTASGPGAGFGANMLGPQVSKDISSQPCRRLWAAVLDSSLEAARRVIALLEAIASDRQVSPTLITSTGDRDKQAWYASAKTRVQGGWVPAKRQTEGPTVWVPLSIAIAALEPQTGGQPSTGGQTDMQAWQPLAPGRLASGLAPPPMLSEESTATWQLSQMLARGAKRRSDGSAESSQFRHLALREEGVFGGQSVSGVAPECVSLADLRGLCGSILEMTCALMYHFCIAMRMLAGVEYGGPAALAMHGLKSLLHELQSLPVLAADTDASDFIAQLSSLVNTGSDSGGYHQWPAAEGD